MLLQNGVGRGEIEQETPLYTQEMAWSHDQQKEYANEQFDLIKKWYDISGPLIGRFLESIINNLP